MNPDTKITWLKRVLLIKIAVCLLVWGLPSLLGNAWMLNMFGVTMPADPFFLRIFGAVQTAMALLYWFAYVDPVRNRDIIKFAVVDNVLSTLAILGVAFTTGLSSWFFGVSAVITALFAIAFWILLPKE